MDRFREEPDGANARCEWCDFNIDDHNKVAAYKVWEKHVGIADPAAPLAFIRAGVKWKRPAVGPWWYREIDGCTTCHKEAAKENAVRFLDDGDLESAMDELAEALGFKVAA